MWYEQVQLNRDYYHAKTKRPHWKSVHEKSEWNAMVVKTENASIIFIKELFAKDIESILCMYEFRCSEPDWIQIRKQYKHILANWCCCDWNVVKLTESGKNGYRAQWVPSRCNIWHWSLVSEKITMSMFLTGWIVQLAWRWPFTSLYSFMWVTQWDFHYMRLYCDLDPENSNDFFMILHYNCIPCAHHCNKF